MLDVAINAKFYRTADGPALKALDEVRLQVAPGEFVCLTGPSGCGKTTLLRLVLGLDADFEGSISWPEGRVAAVFQEPRLLPWRDVEQNVRLALPADMEDADLSALFELVGLDDATRLFPTELSLGMARRVSLARAFAIQPTLLTLDEPFVSLDDDSAARLRAELMDVWRARPTTILMVTHNLREAIELADRVIVLSARPGSIVADHRIETPREARGENFVQQAMLRFAHNQRT